MKTDRLLLVAIVAVMAAVVGYLFFSDDTRAAGGGDPAAIVDANAARTSLGASEKEKQTAASRKDCEPFTLPKEFQGRSAEDVAAFFGEREAYRVSLANAQVDDYAAGKSIYVPHAWVAAYETRLAAKEAKGAEANGALAKDPTGSKTPTVGNEALVRHDPAKPTPDPETKTSGKTPVKPPVKEPVVAKGDTSPKRAADSNAPTESSRPWAKFLMTSKATSGAGSAAPSTAGREERRPVSTSAANLAEQPTAGRAYKAKQGETLWKIAEVAYGKGSRWKEIAVANQSLVGADGAGLRAGMVISIP